MNRVNSFVTKSSTWGGADKDLAKKVRSKIMERNTLTQRKVV